MTDRQEYYQDDPGNPVDRPIHETDFDLAKVLERERKRLELIEWKLDDIAIWITASLDSTLSAFVEKSFLDLWRVVSKQTLATLFFYFNKNKLKDNDPPQQEEEIIPYVDADTAEELSHRVLESIFYHINANKDNKNFLDCSRSGFRSFVMKQHAKCTIELLHTANLPEVPLCENCLILMLQNRNPLPKDSAGLAWVRAVIRTPQSCCHHYDDLENTVQGCQIDTVRHVTAVTISVKVFKNFQPKNS